MRLQMCVWLFGCNCKFCPSFKFTLCTGVGKYSSQLLFVSVQAELWKTDYDELEDDDNFIHYVEMMNRQVPHAAVAAKLERDGEDEETVKIANHKIKL